MPIDMKDHPHSTDPTAALSQLTNDLADVLCGFEKMDAEAGDLPEEVARLHALHKRHAAELVTAAETMGGHPEDTGATMMGAVNVAAANASDWFEGLSGDPLEKVRVGEERLVASYAAARKATGDRPKLQELILKQRDALSEQLSALGA